MNVISNPSVACVGAELRVAPLMTLLGRDYEPSHLVLDSHDYAGQSEVLDEFRDLAFSWTPDRPKDRVPAYLLRIMNDPSCLNLVWISHRTIAFDEELFSWVVAHELRHVYQSRCDCRYQELRAATRDLRRDPRFLMLPPTLFGPEELDSEFCALQTVAGLFWINDFTKVCSNIRLPRYPFPIYNQFLLELYPQWLH